MMKMLFYTEALARRPGQHCGLRNHFTHKARIQKLRLSKRTSKSGFEKLRR
jgi:hypothetical protein